MATPGPSAPPGLPRPAMQRCTGTAAKPCCQFLSPIIIDPHPTCTKCRGKECSFTDTCDICAAWPTEQWLAFASKCKRSLSQRSPCSIAARTRRLLLPRPRCTDRLMSLCLPPRSRLPVPTAPVITRPLDIRLWGQTRTHLVSLAPPLDWFLPRNPPLEGLVWRSSPVSRHRPVYTALRSRVHR